MSTRANYIFKSGRKTLATFYIHHDGYPKGAADYFPKCTASRRWYDRFPGRIPKSQR